MPLGEPIPILEVARETGRLPSWVVRRATDDGYPVLLRLMDEPVIWTRNRVRLPEDRDTSRELVPGIGMPDGWEPSDDERRASVEESFLEDAFREQDFQELESSGLVSGGTGWVAIDTPDDDVDRRAEVRVNRVTRELDGDDTRLQGVLLDGHLWPGPWIAVSRLCVPGAVADTRRLNKADGRATPAILLPDGQGSTATTLSAYRALIQTLYGYAVRNHHPQAFLKGTKVSCLAVARKIRSLAPKLASREGFSERRVRLHLKAALDIFRGDAPSPEPLEPEPILLGALVDLTGHPDEGLMAEASPTAEAVAEVVLSRMAVSFRSPEGLTSDVLSKVIRDSTMAAVAR
jgi:hypothetical protein